MFIIDEKTVINADRIFILTRSQVADRIEAFDLSGIIFLPVVNRRATGQYRAARRKGVAP